MATVVHILLPGQEVGRAESRARETVAGFLRRTGWKTDILPTICVINDQPIMRADWRRRRIRAADVVEFRTTPLGPGNGGGSSSTKSTLGLIGMIALSALAPGIGTLVGGGLLGGLLSAGFVAGGGFLLNTFLNPGSTPGQTQEQALYAFGAQTNSARPLDAIPVRYGRTRVTPDYAAVPWTEFVGQDQYLNMILVNGLGRYQRELILIDDTVLWDRNTGVNPSYEGVEIQALEPGEDVTLFPVNVATSAEVSGQELADPAIWIYGGIINNVGTTATKLAFDVVLPQGLGITGSNGAIGQYGCHVQFERQPVNASGVATGPWELATETVIWRASKKPERATLFAEVPGGRYAVRGRRVVPQGYMAGAFDQVLWAGARAYLSGPQSFAGVSVTAIRMKATAQLTQASSNRINVVDLRILPRWNGTSWEETPTRHCAWAAYDIATNTDYGARWALSKTDAQAFVDLAALNDARGDFFDYEFRSNVPVADALDTALAPCRAKHTWLGDVLSVVREQWQAVPSMLITDQQIVRGSLEIEYLLQAEDTADSLIIEYSDDSTWDVETVQWPEGMPVATASRRQLPGATSRPQVTRECKFLWKQNVFRRTITRLSTEQDGRLLSVGEHVTIQSEIPMEWGASGLVVQRSGNTLTLDPAPAWEIGQSYILLRQPTGEPFGPVKASRSGADQLALIDATDLALVESQQGTTLAAVLDRDDGDEPATFAIGLGTDWQHRAIVMSGTPDGDLVRLECIADYEEVHDDDGAPSALPPRASLSDPRTPLIGGLTATLEQNVLEPVLSASWIPAAGARSYISQISYDGKVTWAPLIETVAPNFSIVVEPRALSLRVAAIGIGQGAWSFVDLDAPMIDASRVPGFNLIQGNRDLINNQLRVSDEQLRRDIELVASHMLVMGNAIEAARIAGETQFTVKAEALGARVQEESIAWRNGDDALAANITTVSATANSAVAAVTVEQAARISADGALATRVDNVEASVEGIAGSVRAEWAVSSAPSGVYASYQLTARAENSNVGFYIMAQNGSPGYVAIDADKFYMRSSSGSPFAVFDTVGGNVYMRSNMYLDGSITAVKLSVDNLQAISANMGTLTAGRLLSPDGKVDFNLSSGYLLVSS